MFPHHSDQMSQCSQVSLEEWSLKVFSKCICLCHCLCFCICLCICLCHKFCLGSSHDSSSLWSNVSTVTSLVLWRLWLLVVTDRGTKGRTMSPIELFWTANKAHHHLDDHQPRSRIGSEGLVLRSKHFRLCLDFIGSDFTFELWRKRKLQISNLLLLTKLSFLLLTFQEEIVILYN